jgi:hypothetical protein
MDNKLDSLLRQIKALEQELIEELQKQQQNFSYEVRKKKVYFEQVAIERQRKQLVNLWRYLSGASFKHLLSIPVIWGCLLPTLLFDLAISAYHAICFPLYGIEKVKRQDYIVFDRHYLQYLNLFEKLNCAYCSYFNGLIAYVQEIAARTERFWCPIKHAQKSASIHKHYQSFFDYGDAESYRKELTAAREAQRNTSGKD